SIDHGRGNTALTISGYDKNNGTFYLKNSKYVAFCAPYDEVNWDSCYLTTYGRLDSKALVTSLK
ncbi:MAG: hypothetical protein K2I14_05625, partial [Eubacterium sp.]|nr:hypothetical protein [Eubacterium sp.]